MSPAVRAPMTTASKMARASVSKGAASGCAGGCHAFALELSGLRFISGAAAAEVAMPWCGEGGGSTESPEEQTVPEAEAASSVEAPSEGRDFGEASSAQQREGLLHSSSAWSLTDCGGSELQRRRAPAGRLCRSLRNSMKVLRTSSSSQQHCTARSSRATPAIMAAMVCSKSSMVGEEVKTRRSGGGPLPELNLANTCGGAYQSVS
mmetsp:Transcript_44285/g.128056  ORF Transcript_44285/g.128056 Transcript_44285/m.128056 type:complete len:206 (+) Transcript_44285:488-1105(+)